jgi:ribosomal protein L35
MKRNKAAASRFKIVGNGKIKFWSAGRVHNSSAKSRKRHRLLRKPKYLTGARRRKIFRMLLGTN